MNQTEKVGQCIYCGSVGDVTRDHVPPKCLFSKPRPSNLISVPACRKCHSDQTSKDDEYFRLVLHSREDIEKHPDVRQARPTVMRSFDKPTKAGMIYAFLSSVTPIEVVTPSGIFVKQHLGFYADMGRMSRVVTRMVKGLFYHEKDYRLADTYLVYSQSEDSVHKRPQSEKEFIEQNIVKPLLIRRPVTIGNQVFSYRVGFSDDDPNFSAWMFEFYGRARFLGLTLPPEARSDGFK